MKKPFGVYRSPCYRKYTYQDWRLPNIRELESIADMEKHSPAIASSERFTNIQPFYRSSTTSVYEPRYAWTPYAVDGNLGVGYKSNPEFHVWCVRDFVVYKNALPVANTITAA